MHNNTGYLLAGWVAPPPNTLFAGCALGRCCSDGCGCCFGRFCCCCPPPLVAAASWAGDAATAGLPAAGLAGCFGASLAGRFLAALAAPDATPFRGCCSGGGCCCLGRAPASPCMRMAQMCVSCRRVANTAAHMPGTTHCSGPNNAQALRYPPWPWQLLPRLCQTWSLQPVCWLAACCPAPAAQPSAGWGAPCQHRLHLLGEPCCPLADLRKERGGHAYEDCERNRNRAADSGQQQHDPGQLTAPQRNKVCAQEPGKHHLHWAWVQAVGVPALP